MSEELDKVLRSVEPDGENGWIEYALKNALSDCEPNELPLYELAAKELETLRFRVAKLEKKLADRDEMLREEQE